MSHPQEVESGEGPGSHRAPPTQRYRQANGRVGEGERMRSAWRPCQQHSQGAENPDERHNHRHGNQHRYRRYDSSGRGGGRTRGSRGPAEEVGPQQQPRPGVTRYRRAQQPRNKNRQQGEVGPRPMEEVRNGPTQQQMGSVERAGPGAEAGMGQGGDTRALSGPQVELVSADGLQYQTEAGEDAHSTQTPPLISPTTPPPHSPNHSKEALNPKKSHCTVPPQQGEQCSKANTKTHTEPNPEPTAEPKAEPSTEPNNEPNAESDTEPNTEPYTEPYSHTDGSTELHIESFTELYTESYTDSHEEQGQVYEHLHRNWEEEEEWVRQTALQLRRAGMRLFEQGGLVGGQWQRRTVGSRLHHYDGHSDGDSDSPEKEVELPLSPQEPAEECVETVFRRRRRSWSMDRALGEDGDWPESEQASHEDLGSGGPEVKQIEVGELVPDILQDEQTEVGVNELGPGETQQEQASLGELVPDEPQDEQAEAEDLGPAQVQDEQAMMEDLGPGEPQDEQASLGDPGPSEPQDDEASQGEQGLDAPQNLQDSPGDLGLIEPQGELAETEDEPGRKSWGKADSLTLAIRDIKEAIQEVKTRTIRSPYTPEEPSEPVWVMRQDFSPTTECDQQPSPGGDSLDSTGSASPLGAESTNRLQMQDVNDNFESPPSQESRKTLASFPTYVDVPGPCDPEDLIDGIIFAANYLGSTQLLSEKTPSKSVRMTQAQEAVSRIRTAKSRKKCLQTPEGQTQLNTEVDLFISTQRIKVLNADTQEAMMDHPLRTISYIADIGDIVVLMARRKRPRPRSQGPVETGDSTQEGKGQFSEPAQEGRGQYNDPIQEERRQYRMICHVFESEDAQLIAQSIGQAFSVAYQEFLRANGINPEDLSQREYSDLLSTQDMYNDDLIHFSKSENCKDIHIEKQKGEILGVVVVESGWGSILPTVIIANMMHGGPAEKSGRLNIGDQIMSINGTSLVGLPLTTCQSIIKALKSQPRVKLNIVRCPPVTTVLIRRPDLRYQLGFSVQNGIICSLMRGGIAERGGVRVGHRIIEISGQSVVATPHERIVNILSNAVGEIHMKTMPAAMYRLLTGQEQPIYI
ncbi:hypothetical protein AGOR_G00010740 [Albula goreensis]|uniref:Uncharacterized protein n=1 Tax=Albula goreensis TaxID=1534307 RepID=A0A8T3E651_9TELE|nr:hypothetical protein AGOR_G00010740 [Albula goreensis]